MQIKQDSNIHIKTHNDLDAVASVVLLRNCYNQQIVSVEYNAYNSIEESIRSFIDNHEYTAGDTLVITDISFSNELAEELDNIKDLNVQMYDHHKTAMRLSKFKWATIDDNPEKSATEVVYDHLIIEKTTSMDKFVKAVSAWDTWLLSSPERGYGEALNTLLGFIGKDVFVHEFLDNINAGVEKPYIQIIEHLLDKKNRYVSQVVRRQGPSAKIRLDGLCKQYVVIFATDYISEIGNKVLEYHKENIDYVCVINPVFNSASLRSAGDMDVSVIAKYLGGGGHKHASGFSINFTTSIEETIDQVLNHINY